MNRLDKCVKMNIRVERSGMIAYVTNSILCSPTLFRSFGTNGALAWLALVVLGMSSATLGEKIFYNGSTFYDTLPIKKKEMVISTIIFTSLFLIAFVLVVCVSAGLLAFIFQRDYQHSDTYFELVQRTVTEIIVSISNAEISFSEIPLFVSLKILLTISNLIFSQVIGFLGLIFYYLKIKKNKGWFMKILISLIVFGIALGVNLLPNWCMLNLSSQGITRILFALLLLSIAFTVIFSIVVIRALEKMER